MKLHGEVGSEIGTGIGNGSNVYNASADQQLSSFRCCRNLMEEESAVKHNGWYDTQASGP